MKWTPGTTTLAILAGVLLLLLLRTFTSEEGYTTMDGWPDPYAEKPGNPLWQTGTPLWVDMSKNAKASIWFKFTTKDGKLIERRPFPSPTNDPFVDSFKDSVQDFKDPVQYATYLLAFYILKYRRNRIDKREAIDWIERLINGFEAPHPMNPRYLMKDTMYFIRDLLQRNFKSISVTNVKLVRTDNPGSIGYPTKKA